MTPEQAQYYLTLLKLGEYDEYDQALDRLLEEQDPLSDLVLELAFCMSDRRQTISVLHNFLLDHPADRQVLYDAYLTGLRKRYQSGAMSPHQTAAYLYSLITANDWESPWDDLFVYLYEYDLYDDGYISREVFEKCFDSHFVHGIRLDPWKLQGEENSRKGILGKLGDILFK